MAKVLVVDDQPPIRHLLDALLNLNGYEVILAENGRIGLELYQRECPDAVALGPKMPVKDGIKVLEGVRKLNPNQPVIIFTGDGSTETKELAGRLGANEMIEQDFPPRRLMGTLKRLLVASTPCYRNSDAFETRMTEGNSITYSETELLSERDEVRECTHPIQALQCDENGYSTSRYTCIACGTPCSPPLYA